MSTATTVIVQDPVNARELFDAARTVIGNPDLWALHPPGSDSVGMYQTKPGQGMDAMVSVHFPAAVGGLLPADEGAEPPEPDGYAHVMFTAYGERDEDETKSGQAELVYALGRWLDACGLRWRWSTEGGPWADGASRDWAARTGDPR
jgi:hypothetical protein